MRVGYRPKIAKQRGVVKHWRQAHLKSDVSVFSCYMSFRAPRPWPAGLLGQRHRREEGCDHRARREAENLPPTAPGGVPRLRRGDSTRGVGFRAGAVLPMGGYFCGAGPSRDVIPARWLWTAVPEANRRVSNIAVYNSVGVVYPSMLSPLAAVSASLDRRYQVEVKKRRDSDCTEEEDESDPRFLSVGSVGR